MKFNGYIEIIPGIWYCEADGTPWSNRTHGRGFSSHLTKLNCSSHDYYYVRVNRKMKSWHRVVYEFFKGKIPKHVQVDHISNNRKDSRISNLQLLNNKENSCKRKTPRTNKSGYIGVCWYKRGNNWRVHIGVNGTKIHIGYFDDLSEAAAAYKAAKIRYHGASSIVK